MRRSYATLEEFPVWFYNLPPVHEGTPAHKTDRPPLVRLALDASGYLDAPEDGTLQFGVGDDVRIRLRVDDRDYTHEQAVAGVRVPAGTHHVTLGGDLERSQWALQPQWISPAPVWKSKSSIAPRCPAGNCAAFVSMASTLMRVPPY